MNSACVVLQNAELGENFLEMNEVISQSWYKAVWRIFTKYERFYPAMNLYYSDEGSFVQWNQNMKVWKYENFKLFEEMS
jgi:hypothetical protein